MINLLKGDCLELLKTLENESVDALITDPPYNIARDNNFTSMGRAGIDFGDWDKDFDLTSWISVAVDKVKKGGKWTFNRQSETYERPLIKTRVTPKSEKTEGAHPTQKSLEAMEWIIERLTNENDIVLDPFIGSGTTGVACNNLNRYFTGFELDDEYFSIAKKKNRKVIIKCAFYSIFYKSVLTRTHTRLIKKFLIPFILKWLNAYIWRVCGM